MNGIKRGRGEKNFSNDQALCKNRVDRFISEQMLLQKEQILVAGFLIVTTRWCVRACNAGDSDTIPWRCVLVGWRDGSACSGHNLLQS